MPIRRLIAARIRRQAVARCWAVCGMCLLILSCATTSTPTPITDPSQRLHLLGFSVLPPQGGNWYLLASPGPKAKATGFMKQTGRHLHTVLAVAGSVELGSKRFTTPEGFLAFVTEYDKKNTSAKRFKVLESSYVLDHNHHTPYCTRIDKLVEDHGVPRFPGIVFYMTSHDVTCIHPNHPNLAIRLGYSQRAPRRDELLDLHSECEPFIKSLEFTSVE